MNEVLAVYLASGLGVALGALFSNRDGQDGSVQEFLVVLAIVLTWPYSVFLMSRED